MDSIETKKWDPHGEIVESIETKKWNPHGEIVDSIDIKEVESSADKHKIAREILAALPEWFGIAQAREAYIRESENGLMYAAYEGANPIGFIALKESSKDTVELFVLGVLKAYHRRGIGRKLFDRAKKAASLQGYSFLQVKTVKMGKYEEYDITNRFYLAMGFKEFELFPTLWDENNPCQVYVMYLGI